VPSVSGAEKAVRLASAEMKISNMLSPSTDIDALAKKAFVHLDGVSDEWLNSLKVEQVAGGKVPQRWYVREYAMNNFEDFCMPCVVPDRHEHVY
jgi:hypothetical protein